MNKNLMIFALLLAATMLTACGKPKDGLNGADGKDGHDGKDGSSCSVTNVAPNSVAPNGGSMISCTDGSTSLVLNGSNGQDGSDGADGRDGSPGTVVASVQFCPGTTSYPAKFNEVGFCIDNKLYAVYSTNGGFMAHIPPGTYTSNGVNSSCSFKVLDNCEIAR